MHRKLAIHAALLRQLVAASNTSIVTSTFLALVLALMQREVIASSVILSWLSLVVLVAISRIILTLAYKQSPLAEYSFSKVRLLRFRLGVLVAGIVWGSAGIVLFPANDPHHQLFLIFMLAGLTTGGVVSYSADLISAIGFSLSALVPVAFRLLIAGDSLSVAMGMAGILYLGFLVMSLRHINRNILENIKLHLEASEREDAMRASEERYRLVLNHSPVGIIHYDTNLVITYCNDRFADILNNSSEHLVGLDMKLLKDQSVLPALSKALAGELGTYAGHYRATLSNAEIWLNMTCAPSRDIAGKIVGGVSIVQNVTALHESHQQLYSLLNSMAEGAYGIDSHGRCSFVNRAFLRILGYDNADEIIGRPMHELIHHSYPDGGHYPASDCKIYNAFRHNQEIHTTDEVFWNKAGVAIPVEYWSQPILEGKIMQGAVVTFIDITDRKQMLDDLRESEERFRQMFERHSAVMLLIEPTSRTIVDANPAAASFYGYPLESLRGKAISEINLQSEDEIAKEMQQALKEKRNYFVFDHSLANGEIRTVEVHSSPVTFKNKPLNFSIIHDITVRKLAEIQIRNLAFYDALTQLPNRRLLYDRLGQMIASSRRSRRYAAVLFLDLDNFKPLNDLHGHVVGDLLLVEVANRLKALVRQIDTVARFGGDEFVVVLSELDVDKAESVTQADNIAEKIRNVLAESYTLKIALAEGTVRTIEHHCTTSIGVVVFLDHTATPDELIKRADRAMYQAKEAGRNSIRFDETTAMMKFE